MTRGGDTRWEFERAIRRSDLPALARHVALTLATYTEGGTTSIPAEHTPSLTDLARATGQSRRQVAYNLAKLEAGDWVDRLRDLAAARAQKRPTRYRLRIPPGARDALDGEAWQLDGQALASAPRALDEGSRASDRTSDRTSDRASDRASARGAHKEGKSERQESQGPARAGERALREHLDGQGPTGTETDFFIAETKTTTEAERRDIARAKARLAEIRANGERTRNENPERLGLGLAPPDGTP